MGRFGIQLLLEDNTWTLLNLDFAVENYGIKLILDQNDTALSDMSFSNITITHSVY